jgi:ABC-type bacteriocin/lantibiotic exporter with double-glycine peptidase domain
MRSISFKYEGATKASLKEINFSLKKGDSIGIIGTSGAGKTTLIDVLLGLLNPQKGVIYLDDNKLTGDRWDDWRKQVAYIPQEIFLFDDSLKKNIALGIKEELIDDERLNKAVSQAQLRSLVEELPQGVDTIIGEHGVLLSGGQRQRIALARAFYFQRNVLIMDEATSALDDATEKEITKEIRMLKNKVTMIVIAHRFSTVQHCDKIYRLENGEIVAEGSFTEVVGTEGS